jgi:uncharacterized protein (DUF983 family)
MAPTNLRRRPCPYCGKDNIVSIFCSIDTCDFCGGEYRVVQTNKLWAIPLFLSVVALPLSIIMEINLEFPGEIFIILSLLCGYMLERGDFLKKRT